MEEINVAENHESKLSKLRDLLSHISKETVVIFLILVVAVPITITLARQQQILQKDASETEGVLAETTGASKPNVVIIMLDDVNPMDGRLFTQARTPNIYKYITSKGINFTNFYVETSLCCPARVGFMTGQHTQNHGVNDLDGTKFNPANTIATELKNVNYRPMLVGKYINNYLEVPVSKRIPPGWVTFDAIYSNNGKYYNYNLIHKNNSMNYYGSSPSDYSTKVLGEYSVNRLKSSPSDKQIYLEYNPYAVHGPRTVEPKYVGDSRCKSIPAWNSPAVNEQDKSDKSKWVRDLKAGTTGYDLTTDCELILSVDEWVGKIGAELTRQGRLSNTVFVLSADNGYGFKEHNIPAKTAPYVTHVPLYIAWPAGRGTTPRIDDTVLSNIDFPVTWCELAGCTMGPFPNGQTRPDGMSFAALLKDKPYPYYRTGILESQPIKPDNAAPDTRPAWWAIRTTAQNPLGMWHYIEYATGEKELYDLSGGYCYNWKVGDPGDPCELDNLLSPNAKRAKPANLSDIQAQLKAQLNVLKTEKGVTPILLSPTPSSITPSEAPSGTPTNTPATSPTPTVQQTNISQQTIQLTPKADAFVKSDFPASNFGTSSTLNSKATNPIAMSYYKFTLPGSTLNGKTIDSAVLKLTVPNIPSAAVGSSNRLTLKSVDSSWTETGLKYSNKPESGATIGTKNGAIAANSSFEINVLSGLNGKTNGDVSFVLESTGTNANNVNIQSKEASSGKPTLIITYH